MRRLFVLYTMLFLSTLVVGQITVDKTQTDNRLNCRLNAVGAGPLDLFFSISPDGRPQYGSDVTWNLNNTTNDEARHYYARKGIYDRDDLEEYRHVVDYQGDPPNPPPFPPNATPNINMGQDNWIKLGTSWNFAADNFNIAIISVMNRSRETIHKGNVNLRFPNSMQAHVTDVAIYNDWAEPQTPVNDGIQETRPFMVYDLQPGEIRHIYVYLDLIRRNGKEKIQQHTIEAEFEGYGSSAIDFDLTNPPHDPNELYLINAIENSMYDSDCSIFEGHAVLKDRCESGLPYWYIGDPSKPCKPRDPMCWLKNYTLNYPYCHGKEEDLVYKIKCLNDGEGKAKDILKKVEFLATSIASPFEHSSFEIVASSHSPMGSWDYPKASFKFEEIYLPGLGDPDNVWTYDECSAYVTFKLRKICNTKSSIDAVGSIEFFGGSGASAGVVSTSHVITETNASPTYPVNQSCISCSMKRLAGQTIETWNTSAWVSDQKTFVKAGLGWETNEATISVFNVAGVLVKNERFNNLTGDELLQFSNASLPQGLYILAVLHNGREEVQRLMIN